MTKEQLVKSLRACGRNCCDDCVCFKEKMLCKVKNLEAADLIEQQAARIKELETKQALGVEPSRLRKLAEADKEGRVAVLPCAVGGSMLDMSDIEHPEIMKRLHFAVAYEQASGIVFYMPYNIFRENIDAGYVQPLSKDAEKALEATKDE